MNDYPSFFQSVVNVWRDIALAFAISGVAGVVAHLHELRKTHPVRFSLVAFLVDIGSSALVGFVALMLCIEHQVSPFMTGPIVGVASHAAPRLIFISDQWIAGALKTKLGVKDDNGAA